MQLVALGNPHFSLSECAALAELCRGAAARGDAKRDGVALVVTTGRDTLAAARAAGHAAALEAFGATLVADTCWCMLTEPVVPPAATALVTNSAKYAHYAPGLVGREVRFAGLADCVTAAVTGRVPRVTPGWCRAPPPAPTRLHSGRAAPFASLGAARGAMHTTSLVPAAARALRRVLR